MNEKHVFNPNNYLQDNIPMEIVMGANRLVHACPRCKGPMQDQEEVVNWGTCDFCFNKDYNETRLFVEAGIGIRY